MKRSDVEKLIKKKSEKPIRAKKKKKVFEFMGIKMKSQIEVNFAELLQDKKVKGEIESWHYESLQLDLALNLKAKRVYTPDFVVESIFKPGTIEGLDHLENTIIEDVSIPIKPRVYEIKGWGRCFKCGFTNSAQREKGIKIFENAANLYIDQLRFILVEWDSKNKCFKFKEYKRKGVII